MANSNVKTSSVDRYSLRDIFGGILFYIGIPAVTLYPLGFMALFLQLWRDPDFPYDWASSGFNFAILWYAASLVPKVVAIGTGVRLLFISLLSTVLSMSIASITLHLLREWDLLKSRIKPTAQDVFGEWEHLSSWERRFWRLCLVALLPMVILVLHTSFPVDSWYDAPFYIGYFAFSAVGGVVLGYIRFRRHDSWVHHGVSLAFVGAVVAALCLSALELPNLPYVQLEASTSWPNSLSTEPFRLLASDSSHWYVYNHENGILSVDQSDAKSVRYWDETKRRTSEPNPDEDGRVNSG